MHNRLLAINIVRRLSMIMVALISSSLLILLTSGVGHASCHPRTVNCCGQSVNAGAVSSLSVCTGINPCCSVCSGDSCTLNQCCADPCSCNACAANCSPWLCDLCYTNPDDPCCTDPNLPFCAQPRDECANDPDPCCKNKNQCCTSGN